MEQFYLLARLRDWRRPHPQPEGLDLVTSRILLRSARTPHASAGSCVGSTEVHGVGLQAGGSAGQFGLGKACRHEVSYTVQY